MNEIALTIYSDEISHTVFSIALDVEEDKFNNDILWNCRGIFWDRFEISHGVPYKSFRRRMVSRFGGYS